MLEILKISNINPINSKSRQKKMGCVFSIKIIHPEEMQKEEKNEQKNILESESDEESYNIVSPDIDYKKDPNG